MFNIITLDNPNNTAYIDLKGTRHLFTDYATFKNLTSYPFDNTVLLSYEPERNIFVVERLGGELISGEEVEEIVWCNNNINLLIEKAVENGYGQILPGPSLSDVRNQKLFETDWMVLRHRDQTDSNIETSLTIEQYSKLLAYRQELRDITDTYDSLDTVIWPILDL